MNKQKFIECLLGSHIELMKVTEAENPSVVFQAKLDCTEKFPGFYRHTFAVHSTSKKVKLSKMIEEKVYIKHKKHEIEGKIIFSYENKLTVVSKHDLDGDSLVSIVSHANHINEILLKDLQAFINSSKVIHPCIFENYKESVIGDSFNFLKEDLSDKTDQRLDFFNSNLNDNQKMAVIYSIYSNDPFKILGPPGTGKTETIVEIICQFLKQKMTVIVCGPSNISVDNIINRFIPSKYNLEKPTNFYRLGSSIKGLTHFNLENMANKAVDFMEKEENEKNFYREKYQRKQEFIRNFKSQTPLVFSTLFSSLKENFFFDLCIVDEACQATQVECFMGIVKAKKFILVGDPNQLCPNTSSLYEHLDIPTAVLNVQYRMPFELMAFSNNHFYKNLIVSSKTDDFSFFSESKILFIDTSHFNFQEEESSLSRMNHGEAMIIKDVVEWIGKDKDIGVIAPYSAQVLLLRDIVNCNVETVDGFQGQEKDFIILSMVRSNDDWEVGFLRDRKRINVAITRCRKGLVVVGDASNFVKDPFLKSFFRFLESNSFVTDPETFKMLIEAC